MHEYHTVKSRRNLYFEEKQSQWPLGYFSTATWSCWRSIAVPLTNLHLRSLRESKVYGDWKVARLNLVFKNTTNAFSRLSVTSKILQSCVTDSIADHVFTHNQLVIEYQWAYRKGHSTDLLLTHLTETWRGVLDSNLVAGVLFIDFQKRLIAFLTKFQSTTLRMIRGSRGTYMTG